MRGDDQMQEEMFSYGSLSQRVPPDHPLRRIRLLADEAMVSLEPRFQTMYAKLGRPSVPPEQMLRALLLQMLYSVVRSGCFFGWLKNTAQLRKTRHKGHRKLDWNFTLAAAAYNLVRMATLTAAY